MKIRLILALLLLTGTVSVSLHAASSQSTNEEQSKLSPERQGYWQRATGFFSTKQKIGIAVVILGSAIAAIISYQSGLMQEVPETTLETLQAIVARASKYLAIPLTQPDAYNCYGADDNLYLQEQARMCVNLMDRNQTLISDACTAKDFFEKARGTGNYAVAKCARFLEFFLPDCTALIPLGLKDTCLNPD